MWLLQKVCVGGAEKGHRVGQEGDGCGTPQMAHLQNKHTECLLEWLMLYVR